MSIVKIPTEVYRYRPLSTRNHTRVLELQSAKAEDVPLCCALREVDVETEDCIYEALSYTWGEPIFSHKLFVEGELIKITPSLAGALRRFRLQEKARSIWADAVCINQQNDEEKSVQIPMMSSIYCNAHRVLVWLGDPMNEDGVFEQLSALVKKLRMHRETSSKDLADACSALLKLLDLPWFTRCWVVQEVVQNPDVMVFRGVSEISWSQLLMLFHSLSQKSVEVKRSKHATSLMTMSELWKTWGLGDWNGQCGMLWLLESFRHFKCADERDHIYALMSLADDVSDEPDPMELAHDVSDAPDAIEPVDLFSDAPRPKAILSIKADYKLTTLEVYAQFAVTVINGKKELRWLLGQVASQDRLEGWPSWLPHWGIPLGCNPVVGLPDLPPPVFSDVSILPGGRVIYLPNLPLHYSPVETVDRVPISRYRIGRCFQGDSSMGDSSIGTIGRYPDGVVAPLCDVAPLCITWRSKAFPSSPCNPAEATQWFQDTFDSIHQRGASLDIFMKTMKSPIHSISNFVRALLPRAMLREIFKKGVTSNSELRNFTEKLLQVCYEEDLELLLEENIGRTTTIGTGNDADLSDSVAQALLCLLERSSTEPSICLPEAFVTLLELTMRGRCIFTCREDIMTFKRGWRGIGTFNIRENDRLISICHPYCVLKTDYSRYKCPCLSNRDFQFIVWEETENRMSEFNEDVLQKPLHYEFVGDCILEQWYLLKSRNSDTCNSCLADLVLK